MGNGERAGFPIAREPSFFGKRENDRGDFTDNDEEFKTARLGFFPKMLHNFAMNAPFLRLFIAIELSDTLHTELKTAQQQLEGEFRRVRLGEKLVRWVAPNSIHLTLKFLGNVNRAQIPALTGALERAANNMLPFQLTAQGLGCFPNTRRPNNIWVGLKGDLTTVALLARRIENECNALGLKDEARGFTPHLTIGRVKREASNAERAALGLVVENFPETRFGTIHADAVHLIASDLRPTGPIYMTITSVRLESR